MAWKTAEPTLHAADGNWINPPHLEGSLPDTEHGAASTENLAFRRQYQKGFILGLDILRAFDACCFLQRKKYCYGAPAFQCGSGR
jgi:hypothetical protein